MDIVVTLYESELDEMKKLIQEEKAKKNVSAIYSSLGKHGIDVSFQICADHDVQLEAKRKLAEKEGRA